MRFTVNAVSDDDYAQWLADAHTASRSLDAEAYAQLAKPSIAVAPVTYGAVTSRLFDTVVRTAATDCKGQPQ